MLRFLVRKIDNILVSFKKSMLITFIISIGFVIGYIINDNIKNTIFNLFFYIISISLFSMFLIFCLISAMIAFYNGGNEKIKKLNEVKTLEEAILYIKENKLSIPIIKEILNGIIFAAIFILIVFTLPKFIFTT